MTGQEIEKSAPTVAELTGIADDKHVQPINPMDLEVAIMRTRERMAVGIQIIAARRREAKETDRAAERAYAFAFLAYKGSPTEKRQAALVDPEAVEARDAADVAELAYKHAVYCMDQVDRDLSALQTLTKSITSMYASENGVGR